MTFSYPTVTLARNDYPVYGDLSDANAYLVASMSAGTWNLLTTQGDPTFQQSMALISATRWLDRMNWQGKQTDPTQALQFPRSNLTNADGSQVDSDSIPQNISNALFELAALLVDTPDLQQTFQNPMAKSLGAGSARVDYFRPIGSEFGAQDVQTISPLPPTIMPYVQLWLQGFGSGTNVVSTGTKAKSEIRRTDGYGYNHGY